MKLTSYWLDTSQPFANGAAHSLEGQYGERDGLCYSMGYSGHGTQMATLMGSIMAEVMDGKPDLNPWKDFNWLAIFGYFGRPWFLPILGAYFRLKDMIT